MAIVAPTPASSSTATPRLLGLPLPAVEALACGDGASREPSLGVLDGARAETNASNTRGPSQAEGDAASPVDRYHTEIAVTVVSFHKVDLSAIASEVTAATGEVARSRRLPSVHERAGAVTSVVSVEWTDEYPASPVLASTSLNLIYTLATCAVEVPCVIETSITCYDRMNGSQQPVLRLQKGLHFPTHTDDC